MPETLILVPTPTELDILSPLLHDVIEAPECVAELCGFGPITAASMSARLLSQYKPDRVLLVGIAGGIGDVHAIGGSVVFREVGCYGIGAGTGSEYLTAAQLGWDQWSDRNGTDTIGDVLPIGFDRRPSEHRSSLLVTCMSASASADDVAMKLSGFPEAVAEDMEGFGVAVSCRFAGVPLEIVRGISNRAGDRALSGWKIVDALESAAQLTRKILK